MTPLQLSLYSDVLAKDFDKVNAMGTEGMGAGTGAPWAWVRVLRECQRPGGWAPVTPSPLPRAPPLHPPQQNNQLNSMCHTVCNRLEKKSMTNILIRLRQACNHPYLLPGQEPEVWAWGGWAGGQGGRAALQRAHGSCGAPDLETYPRRRPRPAPTRSNTKTLRARSWRRRAGASWSPRPAS